MANLGRTSFAAFAASLLILCSVIAFTSAQTADAGTQMTASVATAVAKAVSQGVTAYDAQAGTPGATAWQAGSGVPPKPQDVNVTMNSTGLNVSVKATDGKTFNLGMGNGGTADSVMNSFRGASDDFINILMPWLPDNTTDQVVASSGPMMSTGSNFKTAVHQAVSSKVADKINFAIKQSDLIKETVNKEISDYISSVNTASGLIRDLIKKKAGLLSAAAGKLGDGVGNIKSAVANVKADGKQAVQDKVENLSGLSSQFTTLSSAMVGDMGSTAGLITDAAATKAKAVKDTYTTAEGLVKAHIDATVQKKVDALNSLLDKFMAAANAVSTADATGPVVDWKMAATQTKLAALESALDKVAAAVKATPTPSQVFDAKMALLGSTRIGHAIMDPSGTAEAALSQAVGKINQVKSVISSKMAAAKLG